MNGTSSLIDRYVAVWNEPDAGRRRTAVAELWTTDAVQVLEPPEDVRKTAAGLGVTPVFEARGLAALEVRVTRSYEEFVAPGQYIFRALGPGARLQDVVKFRWQMVSTADGEVAGTGLEVVVLDAEGKIRTDYQFIEA